MKSINLPALALVAVLSWVSGCARFPGLLTGVDPVCGRQVTEVDAVVREYGGETFYFDTESCARIFDGDPDGYRRSAQTNRADRSWEDEGVWEQRSSEIRDRD